MSPAEINRLVVAEVAKHWCIPADQIASKTKRWAVAEARMAVYRITHLLTGLGTVDVGILLGISHKSVCWAKSRVDELMATDGAYREKVEKVLQSFERSSRFRLPVLRWRLGCLDEADLMFVHNIVQAISNSEHGRWADRIRNGRCAILRTDGGGVEVFEP